MIFDQKTSTFVARQGPVFSNLLLADEVNRAPAKVQSALLECMQEKQVTLGNHTYRLQEPFMVLATQNPIEQEGTYPLPEAQMDRFLMKIVLQYPTRKEEREIMNRVASTDGLSAQLAGGEAIALKKVLVPERIQRMRQIAGQIYIDERIKTYVLDIVFATRDPEDYHLDLKKFIRFGASPRASIGIFCAAKAHAFLKGRGFVIPEDIKSVAPDILRHRILLSYEAEAEGMKSDDIVQKILGTIPAP